MSATHMIAIEVALPYKEARRRLLESFEHAYLFSLLSRHRWNVSAASRAAGVSRKHIRSLIAKYELFRRCEIEP